MTTVKGPTDWQPRCPKARLSEIFSWIEIIDNHYVTSGIGYAVGLLPLVCRLGLKGVKRHIGPITQTMRNSVKLIKSSHF